MRALPVDLRTSRNLLTRALRLGRVSRIPAEDPRRPDTGKVGKPAV